MLCRLCRSRWISSTLPQLTGIQLVPALSKPRDIMEGRAVSGTSASSNLACNAATNGLNAATAGATNASSHKPSNLSAAAGAALDIKAKQIVSAALNSQQTAKAKLAAAIKEQVTAKKAAAAHPENAGLQAASDLLTPRLRKPSLLWHQQSRKLTLPRQKQNDGCFGKSTQADDNCRELMRRATRSSRPT